MNLWNEEGLKRRFSDIGAELVVAPLARHWWRRSNSAGQFTLDIQPHRRTGRDRFVLSIAETADVRAEVLHAHEDKRHLLLLVKSLARQGWQMSRYLCGHDERHWFVASMPDSARPPTTVVQAMDALQPPAIRAALARAYVRNKDRHHRHNQAFLRQGEWFFIPAPHEQIDEDVVLRNEPLRRGGKPHWVQELVRTGGVTRYVCRRHRNGVTEAQYKELLTGDREARYWGWSVVRANPNVFARGRVWHPDHATIVLPGWHRVLLSAERKDSQVVFLD